MPIVSARHDPTLCYLEPHVSCPSCGCERVHHDAICVFEPREAYDEADAQPLVGVTVELIDGEIVRSRTGTVGNPSSRRHGVAIEFCCEDCNQRGALEIAQHKGVTFVSTRKIPGHGERKVPQKRGA